MKGTTPFFTLSFNPVMSIETRPEHLGAAEIGALVQQREMMERSGIVGWLIVRLHDPRNLDIVFSHSLRFLPRSPL